jgi:hypothetical protein
LRIGVAVVEIQITTVYTMNGHDAPLNLVGKLRDQFENIQRKYASDHKVGTSPACEWHRHVVDRCLRPGASASVPRPDDPPVSRRVSQVVSAKIPGPNGMV